MARIFKIQRVLILTHSTRRIVSNKTTYVGLDKFIKFGLKLYNRFNQPNATWRPSKAELFEYDERTSKWKLIDIMTILNEALVIDTMKHYKYSPEIVGIVNKITFNTTVDIDMKKYVN